MMDPAGAPGARHGHRFGRLFRQPHAGREVRSHLRLGLIRKGRRPIKRQSATRPSPLRMEHRLDRHRARLVPVELERRQEVHILDRFDMPAGEHGQGRFRKSLDAHDAGQHRRAVDLVIVQERLNAGSSVVSMVRPPCRPMPGDLAEHRPLRVSASRRKLPQRSYPARRLHPIHSAECRGAGRPRFRRASLPRSIRGGSRECPLRAAAYRCRPAPSSWGWSRAWPCRCRPTPSSR